MAENRCSCGGVSSASASGGRETVCIDTYRVLDSCRDRDCYEDVRVFLSPLGQEIIERRGNVRATNACILWTCISVDPVQFNRGFYQITVRYYIKVTFEACLGLGRPQCFDGVTVVEKKVVLYGGEGGANVFRSNTGNNTCCEQLCNDESNTNPSCVVETVAPIALSTKIAERESGCGCCCCCSCNDLPEQVTRQFTGDFVDDAQVRLFVSIGQFSVIRLERPAQLMITATDYCIPDKECAMAEEDDPCSLFRSMAFPIGEFCPLSGNRHREK